MVNLNKVLKKINGEEAKKSFSTPEEVAAGTKETIKNVLLNALASFPITDKKQIFWVNTISTNILNAENGEIEFPKDHLNFLEGVLYRQTYQEEKKGNETVTSGVYFAQIIAQVLLELGIKEEK